MMTNNVKQDKNTSNSSVNNAPKNQVGPIGGGPGRMGAMHGPKLAKGESMKIMKRLISYMSSNKVLLFSLVFIMVISAFVGVLFPLFQGKAVDALAYDDGSGVLRVNFELLYQYIIYMVLALVGTALANLFSGLVSAKLSQVTVQKMRQDLFDHLIRVPVKFTDTHGHGDLMSRMTNDVENISNTISQSISSVISGVLTIIGCLIIMFIYSWQLTIISFVTVFLSIGVTTLMAKFGKKYFRAQQSILGDLNSQSEEMITGYKTVVANSKEEDVEAKFNEISKHLTKVSTKAQIIGGSMGPAMNFVSNFGYFLVAAFGAYFALNGMISIGVISMFFAMSKKFSRPISEIAQQYSTIQTSLVGAQRVFEVIDAQPEEDNGKIVLKPEMIKGEITFNNINFSYVPGQPVLKNFNLVVRPGHKIALVGATGSGKTTVVNLLMRFYDVDSGEILLDGINIKDITKDSLRQSIAIVLQDTILFSDTIENNIKYAKNDSTFEEVVEAADMGYCDHFIRRLPNGYQTELAESGSNLSQGQRQLISIARAVLADPRILILDEATSSVDTRTEMNIQSAMVNLMSNRTSLVIAHRLSTIQDADLIVVLDGGEIVESGNHDELLIQKGRYYQLYMSQFAGNEI